MRKLHIKAILFVDTSSVEKIMVAIEVNGKKVEKSAVRPSQAQMVLPMIEEILKSQKIRLSDISEIKVNTGPGSFTGLRVGIAVTNALGFLLEVPVNGKAVPVMAVYQKSKFD